MRRGQFRTVRMSDKKFPFSARSVFEAQRTIRPEARRRGGARDSGRIVPSYAVKYSTADFHIR